jgi:hypothetical protein
MHIAEPFVPLLSRSEIETATKKFKWHKSSCTDKMPAKPVQEGSNTLRSEINRH